MNNISASSIIDHSDLEFGLLPHPVRHVLPPLAPLQSQGGFAPVFSFKLENGGSIEFAVFGEGFHVLVIPPLHDFHLNRFFRLPHHLLAGDLSLLDLLLRLDLLQSINFFPLVSYGIHFLFDIPLVEKS